MELDEDTEGLQATIYLLQQQLKEATDKIAILELNQHTPTTEELPHNPHSEMAYSGGGSQTEDSNAAELTQQQKAVERTHQHEEMETERTDNIQQNETEDTDSPANGHVPSHGLLTDVNSLTEESNSRAMTPTADENGSPNDPEGTEYTPSAADNEVTEHANKDTPLGDATKTVTDGEQLKSTEPTGKENVTAQCDALTQQQQQVHNGHAEMLVN